MILLAVYAGYFRIKRSTGEVGREELSIHGQRPFYVIYAAGIRIHIQLRTLISTYGGMKSCKQAINNQRQIVFFSYKLALTEVYR